MMRPVRHPPNSRPGPAMANILGVVVTLLGWPMTAPSTESLDLRSQLHQLASSHDLVIQNIQRIGSEPARSAQGNLREQIASLLQGYNYALMDGPDGQLARLVILGRRPPTPPPVHEHLVKTKRVGAHHLVEARIVGPNGMIRAVTLLVDTGATTVVLPASLSEPLGFAPDRLTDHWVQTANGNIPAKSAVLPSIAVGDATAADVAITFVADQRLGTTGLLGMSFLERFRVAFDDTTDQIALTAR